MTPPYPEACVPDSSILENAGWMRKLALALLHDEGAADDVIQETWLASLERPIREPRCERTWLSRVVRNLSARRIRSKARLKKREEAVARPESIPDSTADVIDRAETARRVFDEVLALEEPYRSTILLGYYEAREPSEIARARGVPTATVRTWTHRALEKLRARLDRTHGGKRESWRLALFPVAGGGVLSPGGGAAGKLGFDRVTAIPSTVPPLAPSAGLSAGTLSAGTGTHAAALSGLTLGGIVMTQKTVIVAILAIAAATAAGYGLGHKRATSRMEDLVLAGDYVPGEQLAGVKRDLELTASKLRALEEEKSKASAEAEAAKAKAESSEPTKSADAGAPAAGTREAPVAFGKYAALEALRDADWKDIGGAAVKLNDLLLALVEKLGKGDSPSQAEMQEMQAENLKLLKLAAGIMGRIPTQVTGNGEFTHPVVLSNILASMLDHAGEPLSEAQRAEFARLGGDFESAYDEAIQSYGDDTPALAKIVDELDLKQQFMKAARDSLSEAQREAVIHPELTDLSQVDILSPALMTVLLARPRKTDSASDMEKSYSEELASEWKLSEEQVTALRPAIESYVSELTPSLEAKPSSRDGPEIVTLEQSLVAAKAHLKTLEAALQLPGLDPETKARLLGASAWSVPQQAKSKPPAETPPSNP